MTDIEFVNGSTVELVKHNASDADVAYAAWVSNYGDRRKAKAEPREGTNYNYQTRKWEDSEERKEWKKSTQGLINFLYRERHMSPFEHGSFTFMVDTPIFVAREFMRHRTFSYNEVSGRYKKLEPRFYLVDSDRPVKQREGTKVGNYAFDAGTDEQYGQVFAATSLS